MNRYEQDARDIELGAAAEVAHEDAIAAARAQFAAELAETDQPDGMPALYDERTARVSRGHELANKRSALNKTLNRATKPSTIAKTNSDLDDVIELIDLNDRAIKSLDEQIAEKREQREAAKRLVSDAFITELLSDFGRVQYATNTESPTHVEFTPTGPDTDGSTYAIVVRGIRWGYSFEVGLRGDEQSGRFLVFDVDVTGPRASTFGREDRAEPSTINWGAHGSQSVAYTRQFARVLDIAVRLAARLDECLLPTD